MDAPMAGIVTIVFALLLSRKLGWDAAPARITLLLAAVLFAGGLLFPIVGATEQEKAWIVAGQVGTALGALLLVVGVLQFARKGGSKSPKPDAERAKRKRKPNKTATAPPPRAPDPDDPYAGPHDQQA